MSSVHPVGSTTEGNEREIQHYSSAGSNEQSQSIMVAIPGQKVTVKPYCTNSPISDIRVNASNKGWAAVLNGQIRTGGDWLAEERSHTWSCWQHF